MTPDDLATVERSWSELRTHRAALLERLAVAVAAGCETDAAATRARRLVEAADELVCLLSTPSRLAVRARELAAPWGSGPATPRVDVDGDAWLRAAGEVSPAWSIADEVAWRRAWLLLGDVLAEHSLAPFAEPSAAATAWPDGPYVAPAGERT